MSIKQILIHAAQDQKWNIGFTTDTPQSVIKSKVLSPIHWMKHDYKDRFFADPFILNVNNDDIHVLVEECPYENPKGIISELVIERDTYNLKKRYVLLELDTHLSYPAIIEEKGKIYVYPENGQSGRLNIYEYDKDKHTLCNPVCILDEAVADATIYKSKDKYLLFCTKYPNTLEEAYLYQSDSLMGTYKPFYNEPIQELITCSRPGGDLFMVGDSLYRPSQDCKKRYGAALSIMKSMLPEKKETLELVVLPQNRSYCLGIHTINFRGGICVVDGYGYRNYASGVMANAIIRLINVVKQ